MVWPPLVFRPERNVRPSCMDGYRTRTKIRQELHSDYVITDSPVFDDFRSFFRAAVRELIHAYLDYPRPCIDTSFAVASAVGDRLRRVTEDNPQSSSHTPLEDPAEETPETDSLLAALRLSPTTPTISVVTTTARSQTPVDQTTDLLTSGSAEHTQLHIPLSRGAVSSMSLASTDLLSYVEPLPLNQLVCHITSTVRS